MEHTTIIFSAPDNSCFNFDWPGVIFCDLWMLMEETWLDVENNQGDNVLIEMEVTSRGVFWFFFFSHCFPFDIHTGVI